MNILAKDFNAKSLIKYVFPTICMMIFMSTYTIIDGLFVSNLVGEEALSGLNMAWPAFNFVLAIGLMLSTGGTAVMGKLMGEGKDKQTRSFLTVLYIVAIILGLIITTIFLTFPDQIVRFLGVNDELFPFAKAYFTSLAIFSTAFFFQVYVQAFFVLAGKPILGFLSCLIGGVANILFDFILISPNMLNLGVGGAGLATGLGNCVPAIWGIIYFSINRKGTVYFEKPVLKISLLFKSMFNGVSELVSQLSTAVTTFLFNVILLDIAGKSGVASICVIMYIQMIQTAVYFGFSIGAAPIISYKYGAEDKIGLHKIIGISFKFITVSSIAIIAISLLFANFAVSIFINPSSETFDMAVNGLRIYSIGYLFMGINVFMSSMFTALSNGKISALLSFSRTLVFLAGSLLTLPHVLHLSGVWLAVPLAELLSCVLSIYFYKKNKIYYGY